jgi:hypothetical protein
VAELNDNVDFYVNGIWRAARKYNSEGALQGNTHYTDGLFDTGELTAWLNASALSFVQGDTSKPYDGGTNQNNANVYYTGSLLAGAYVTIQDVLYKVKAPVGIMYNSVTEVGTYNGGDIIPFASFFDLATGVPAPIYNGAGVIIDLIDTGAGAGGYDGKADKVIIINKAVRTVAALPSLNAMTNHVSFPGVITSTVHKDLIDYPADIAVKDVVLTYTDNEGVLHVEKANTVTGKLERVSQGVMVTVDGAFYLLSGLSGRTDIFNTTNGYVGNSDNLSANLNKLAQLWLDNGGNIVAIASAEATEYSAYGLVIGYEYIGSSVTGGSAKARLVLQDGTIKVFDVAPNALGVVPNQQSSAGSANTENTILASGATATLVKYTLDNNGAITLLPLGTTLATSTPIQYGTVEDGTSIVNSGYAKGSSVVKIGNSSHYITATTKVFYFDNTKPVNNDSSDVPNYNKVGLVTGYTKTSAVAKNTPVYYAVAANTTQLEAIFFVTNSGGLGATDKYIFFLSASPSAGKDSTGNIDVNYYTGYSVDGGATPITISARLSNSNVSTAINAMVPGLYKYDLDADGFVYSAAWQSDAYYQIATIVNPDGAGTGGYISYGLPKSNVTGGIIYDNSTKFYEVKYPDYTVDIFGSYAETSGVPQSQLKSGVALADADNASNFDAVYYIQGIQPGKNPEDPAAAIYYSVG